MQNYFYRIFIVLGIFYLFSSCNSQTNTASTVKIDRQPAVAGSFYPADKEELFKLISEYFDKAPSVLNHKPLAIIVPHAGIIYSGMVAAAGYKQISRDAVFKHVFIIGSSHTTYFEGVSAYSIGDFITPAGTVTVDTLTRWLVKKYSIISNDIRPHDGEHSIEVQLPFLQYWLRKPFCIVPLIVGGESAETCRRLASVLGPFLNNDNLFIISTDFSHYPNYSDSNVSDSIMAAAILKNSPEAFIKVKNTDESQHIPNLVTAMCGWTSVLTLLDMTFENPDYSFQKILHKNSGDIENGQKDRVVGYYAIALVKKTNDDTSQLNLTVNDKNTLLKIARETVIEYLKNNKVMLIDKKLVPRSITLNSGAFVTLTESGVLRGCIGNFNADKPLCDMVQSMAIAASTEDPRFPPLKLSEINRIKIEISVLSPMKKINSIDEIELGKHGIYIRKGSHSGTFLPQVAVEQNWTKEEYLGHCAQDKALIGWDGWKYADIYIYEAQVFDEK